MAAVLKDAAALDDRALTRFLESMSRRLRASAEPVRALEMKRLLSVARMC